MTFKTYATFKRITKRGFYKYIKLIHTLDSTKLLQWGNEEGENNNNNKKNKRRGKTEAVRENEMN